MPPPLHKCYAPSCNEMIAQNQILCRPHKRLVRTTTLKDVDGTWRIMRNCRTPEEQVKAADEWKMAVQRAIWEVKDATEKRKAA